MVFKEDLELAEAGIVNSVELLSQIESNVDQTDSQSMELDTIPENQLNNPMHRNIFLQLPKMCKYFKMKLLLYRAFYGWGFGGTSVAYLERGGPPPPPTCRSEPTVS